jgi:starch synthase
MIRALFVTSELSPLVKSGGLADVSAGLPRAMRDLGIDCRILLPAYPAVCEALSGARDVAVVHAFATLPTATLASGTLAGLPVLVLRCNPLYGRDGTAYQDDHGQDWPDNARRFALLSHVAALLGNDTSPLRWRPDLLHCNDWPTGLVGTYRHFGGGKRAAVLFGLHNLAYQGNFDPTLIGAFGLPAACFQMHGVEFHGRFSFLKAGLYYSDHIVTVSPTYAAEIQTEEFGCGLHGLLYGRRNQLTGILNGIDEEAWNPATDPYIAQRYSRRSLSRKRANKIDLQERLGLAIEPDVPLLGVVSRLVPQKGVDLVLGILPDLMNLPAQLVVLGAGEPSLESALRTAAAANPGRIAVSIGFDEARAHQIEAGADFFLMPSASEPCGLNQMYSQRYGTPPIVHAVGGLADSVVSLTLRSTTDRTATGLAFSPFDRRSLLAAIDAACNVYRDGQRYRQLQLAGMARCFGWAASAKRYESLYRQLVRRQAPTGARRRWRLWSRIVGTTVE